ncbi:MAG: HAMP domain-containing sensor histidine kinase [Candidatus Nanopelagicales bacterium]|jgi:two-component system, OmpR family, sensor kinase
MSPMLGGRFRRLSIVTPTVLLTSLVAAIAVVIAGFVSYPLIVASSEQVGQRNLAQLANVTANAVERNAGAGSLDSNLISTLQRESISAYLFGPVDAADISADDLPSGFGVGMARKLLNGQEVSARVSTPAGQLLFEGRPLSFGGAVLLVQPVSVAGASAASVIYRLIIALLIGLVIAIPLGYLAARRLARPLRRASETAVELSLGSRGIHIEPEGPREVSDIAIALNSLDLALESSESRQREFLLSVSHELRTPLTAVKGYGEALADGLMSAAETKNAGEIISREAARLDRLINDLLDLARLGAVNFTIDPSQVDLEEFVSNTCEVWSYRCSESNVHFISHPAPHRNIIVDSLRVRQIIDNLTENALRVTPADGRIELVVQLVGANLQIAVSDSGPGLSGEDMAIAFEPGALYERYRGVRPVGTGLGLALVGKLACGLGGSASVQSSELGGAKFEVLIPVELNPEQ